MIRSYLSGVSPTTFKGKAVMAQVLAKLQSFYGDFGPQQLDCLDSIYSETIVFKDPVHPSIEGLPALREYFAAMMARVESCHFDFVDVVAQEGQAFIKWRMSFAHPKLKSGAVITMPGASFIKFDEHIYYHEDFYDMGAMIYEHLPLLGAVVKKIKQRLGEQ